MDLSDVKAVVGDAAHMSLQDAATITTFMRDHNVRDVLELGFQNGVSTSYMASELHNVDAGHITTIDLLKPERVGKEPIESFLDDLGLRSRVTIFYEPSSYNWRLMKMLKEDPEPRFDMCYLDGAHSWAVDGFAFFLVDKLLRPGGWLIMDDLNWSFATSPTLRNADWVLALPEDERVIPQIKRVYEVLVKTHEGYDSFRTEGEWAFARKRPVVPAPVRTVRETVVKREYVGLGGALLTVGGRARRKVARARRARAAR